MFLRFSDDAQKLLLLSLKEKNNLNDSFIGTEHIFLALLSMKKNSVSELLNTFNINYDNFSSFFMRKNDDNYTNYFVFTPLMKNIFKSLGMYINKKNIEINISDIIIEILNEVNSKVVFVLKKMGIDINSLLKNLNVSYKKKKGVKRGILNDLGVNLNNKESNDVLVGRDDEINEIIEILCCKNKNNPILIGDAGVGKTAIVEELARRIEKGQVPYKLKNKKIYSVAISSLVAGTKYRGEFEEKINKLISEVENSDDIILFIDEIHTLVGAGGADGAIDASNILKPSLARGIIKIIGATTKDEYNKYFSDDKALNRCFRVILCEEPDVDKTKEILVGIKPTYEEFHNVIISNEIIDKIVYFADKYIKNRKFPDKAIDVLDEVCVLASFQKTRGHNYIMELDNKIHNFIELKNKSLLLGDYKMAIEYSHEEKKVQSLISKYQMKIFKSNKDILITDKDLLKVMERKTNIPFYTYRYKLNDIYIKLNTYKRETIFNDEVIDSINSYTLNLYESLINKSFNNNLWISSNSKSLNNYFVSNYLNSFFKKNNIIYIDVGNFRNIDELLNLNDKNSFINSIKLYPFSILIINNYDNCDYSIRDFFDGINKYGYYLDKNNEKIDFSNSFLIFNMIEKKNIGFNSINSISDYIKIDGINTHKLLKYIKRIAKKDKIRLSESIINKICGEIVSNYDNLNNLDYLVRKEGYFSNKKINKNRTMKV